MSSGQHMTVMWRPEDRWEIRMKLNTLAIPAKANADSEGNTVQLPSGMVFSFFEETPAASRVLESPRNRRGLHAFVAVAAKAFTSLRFRSTISANVDDQP
jgi:hypothetical protein